VDGSWRARADRRRALGAFVAVLIVCTACSAPPPVPSASPPPPLPESALADRDYALRVLALGQLNTAHEYLERANQLGMTAQANDPHQVLRDLAEVRLFSGDAQGATAAIDQARVALGQQRLNARFTAGERRLFERSLASLDAAARDDVPGLTAQATSAESPPLADAWYLLGWSHEHQANLSAARGAYQAYLDRAPAWSFLRSGGLMRDHARTVVAGQ
jgi:tetratricopeptide (TPR) repeat protein